MDKIVVDDWGQAHAMLLRQRQLLAVEAVVAAQAVDLAAPPTLGRGPRLLHRAIRDILDSDEVRGTLRALAAATS
ncbi:MULTISPECIES: hypothetical protein [Streptomyces]|uniref:Uncharacterized protein n=2 Tax=Streptomyces TaxID=1883 RepID=A0ABV9IKY6_9ACTN